MIRFLQTPGKAKKFILSGMLLLICVAMVWYLVPQGTQDITTQSNVVAHVGEASITLSEVQQYGQRLAQGQQLPPSLLPRVLDMMVSEKAEVLEAYRMGLSVSDAELRDELQHGQLATYIFPDGRFIGQDKYASFVTNNLNETVEQFEQDQKSRLLTRKMENLISGYVTVAPEEVQAEYQRRNLKVKLEYAVLNPDELAKQIHPTDAELKAFFESRKPLYANALPEKRKVKYALLDVSKIQAQVQVSQEELLRYYNDHQAEYRQQEAVNARHILVKAQAGADGKVDPKVDAAALAKAEELLKKLQTGANFEELAKKESDDKASAVNGGSLGWFQRGQMVTEFEQTAFSLPKGQLSGVVKTMFGYHIIRVDDKRAAGMQPMNAVKAAIEPILKQQKAQQQADAQANALLSDVRTAGLDGAAAKHGLQVVNTEWIARTDTLPGIGSSPDFMSALFQATEKSPPAQAQTPQGYAVFQVIGIKPPAAPTFEDIRTQVEQEFKQERVQQLVSQKTQELSDRAHSLHDLKKAAQEVGATLKSSDWLGAQSQAPDIGSMTGQAEAAFSMKQGEISAPITGGRNGIVFSVTDRQEPSTADLQKNYDQIYESLVGRRRGEVIALFLDNLKHRMEQEGKIKINQDQLDAYIRRASLGT